MKAYDPLTHRWIDSVELHGSARALDAGCGNASVAVWLAERRLGNGHVVAARSSAAGLVTAHYRAASLQITAPFLEPGLIPNGTTGAAIERLTEAGTWSPFRPSPRSSPAAPGNALAAIAVLSGSGNRRR